MSISLSFTFKNLTLFTILLLLTFGCNHNKNSIEEHEFTPILSFSEISPSVESVKEIPLDKLVDSINHLYNTGDYQQALDFILIANDKALSLKDDKILARILNLLGLIHWRLENYDDAMEAYREAARFAKENEMLRLVGLTHTNKGLIYRSKKNYELAFFHNNKAITIFTEQNLYRDLAIAYNNQGQIFKNQELNDSAMAYYLKALDNYQKVDYKDGESASYYNLSEIFMRQGLKDKSLESAYISLKLAKEIGSRVRISDAYIRLSETYEYFKELDSSLKYFKLHYEINKNILMTNQSNTLAKYQAKMGAEVKNLQIQNLQKEKELAANKLWLITISILVSVVVSAFVLYRYLSKIRFKKRKLELDLQNSKAILAVKEQELKEYILDLTEKNFQINKLKESLLQSANEVKINDTEVSQLLEQKILTEEDWRIFKNKFNAIYPGFFNHLRKVKTTLSEAEVRFMVLFRLELSGKEMAKILGISPQSVRVCKMRLKKKLQREGYDTVEDFLQLLIK